MRLWYRDGDRMTTYRAPLWPYLVASAIGALLILATALSSVPVPSIGTPSTVECASVCAPHDYAPVTPVPSELPTI